MGFVEIRNKIEVSDNSDKIINHIQECEASDIVIYCERLFKLGDIEALRSLFLSDINCFKKRCCDTNFKTGFRKGYFTAVIKTEFHDGPIYDFHYDGIKDFQYRNGWYFGFVKHILQKYDIKDKNFLNIIYEFYLERIVNEIFTSTDAGLQLPEAENGKTKIKNRNNI